jgi:hypothetical protein
MRILMLGVIASAMLLIAGSAEASVTFTSSAYDLSVPAGQTIVENFDTPIAAGYSFSGGYLEDTFIPNFAAPPAGDTSYYDSVTAYTFATFTSPQPLQSASVYLGSLDDYNYISFLYNGKYVAGFSGGQLVANADGDQFSPLTNRTFDFTFSGQPVNQIVFAATGNSFELDNIAVAPVPEASTWVFMIAGVGAIGGLAWRRRHIAQRLSRRSEAARA